MSEITTAEGIEEFLRTFIDGHIVADVRKLIEINDEHRTSYPYLALAFCGIDLLGAIAEGGSVEHRFCWFMEEWMGKVNPLYGNEHLGMLLYDSCRNGIFHNAILKNTFTVSSYRYPQSIHLHLLSNERLVFLHSIKFAEDFIEAQAMYRRHISSVTDKEYIKGLCRRLNEMLRWNREAKQTHVTRLVHDLETTGHMVDESATSSVSPTTGMTTTSPPLWRD